MSLFLQAACFSSEFKQVSLARRGLHDEDSFPDREPETNPPFHTVSAPPPVLGAQGSPEISTLLFRMGTDSATHPGDQGTCQAPNDGGSCLSPERGQRNRTGPAGGSGLDLWAPRPRERGGAGGEPEHVPEGRDWGRGSPSITSSCRKDGDSGAPRLTVTMNSEAAPSRGPESRPAAMLGVFLAAQQQSSARGGGAVR